MHQTWRLRAARVPALPGWSLVLAAALLVAAATGLRPHTRPRSSLLGG